MYCMFIIYQKENWSYILNIKFILIYFDICDVIISLPSVRQEEQVHRVVHVETSWWGGARNPMLRPCRGVQR